METNKERIEQLEARLRGFQDSINRMELDLTDKLHQMEETSLYYQRLYSPTKMYLVAMPMIE